MTSKDSKSYKYNIGENVFAIINYPGNLGDYPRKPCQGIIVARNYLGPNEVYNVKCIDDDKVYNHIGVNYIENYDAKKQSVEDNAFAFMREKKGYYDSEFGGKRTKKRRAKITKKRRGKKSRKNRKSKKH
jgi:hypothetical protein